MTGGDAINAGLWFRGVLAALVFIPFAWGIIKKWLQRRAEKRGVYNDNG